MPTNASPGDQSRPTRLFICVGKACAHGQDPRAVADALRQEASRNGGGLVEVKACGCLDACDSGPVAVAYAADAAPGGRPPRGKHQPLARFTAITPRDASRIIAALRGKVAATAASPTQEKTPMFHFSSHRRHGGHHHWPDDRRQAWDDEERTQGGRGKGRGGFGLFGHGRGHGHGHGHGHGQDEDLEQSGHRHGHGRGHGRGGRMGRLFAHGDLQFAILHLLAVRPRHGYDIIKAIEEMTGGTYTPSPGTIYPALTLMEEQGYASVTATDGGKKQYALTAEGTAWLEANRGAVDLLLSRLAQAGAMAGAGEPSPRIVRAMENLKTALRLRLTQGTLDDGQIQAIAAALDKAAGEVERS